MTENKIEQMRAIANSKNGECLSSNYINNSSKLTWRCEKGHIWDAIPNNVKNGKWCPVCGVIKRANARKSSITEMKQIAHEKEGKCLSENYINSKTHLIWECQFGHVWNATPSNIKNGKWCPTCAKNKNANKSRKNIADMQELAATKKGKCLSEKYVNMTSKLRWECSEGHQWDALPSNVSGGKWCPFCAGKYKSIEDMRAIADKHNGKCLSTQYRDMKTKLKWQCEKGHIWESTPNSIINKKSWCPMCAGNFKKTMGDMKNLAKSRGGKCLSKIYKGIDSSILWECSNGHQFRLSPFVASKGSWCPICNDNPLFFNEEKCRFILESLLKKNFIKTRKVLGNNLELDGFNDELKLAFEYNGIQHYSFKPYFHRNEEGFEHQVERDKEKKKLCFENSINLIVIPYYIYSDTDKVEFIKHKLRLMNIQVVSSEISWEKFYKGFNPLEELNSIAIERGGRCLSKEYLGTDGKLKWECSNGHTWKSSAYNIKNGSWCTKCLGRGRTIKDMVAIANERGGNCLSDEYINSQTKLTWKCSEGHIWDAVPNSIVMGAWCPQCAGNVLTIDDMHKIAKNNNGKCISEIYTNKRTKLVWECSEGHQWEADATSVYRGTWCPTCKKLKKLDNIQKVAKVLEVECLSEIHNSSDKLLWKCKNNHVWEATPSDVRRGRLCPECKGEEKLKVKKEKLTELKLIAKRREGRCISHDYHDVDTKLVWECKEGHVWESTPYLIKNGSWCPTCSYKRAGEYKKGSIAEMQKLALRNQGSCLSDTYINSQTKLLWKCKEGHQFYSNPNSIQQGSWCPKCKRNETAKKQRKSIADMLELAAIRGGKCLSKEYINAHTKLMWQCGKGHEWEAKPNNIQQGKWCPICREKKHD